MRVAREAAVLPGVLEVHLADDERAAVALEQQLEVLRLLHRPVVVEPDHLREKHQTEVAPSGGGRGGNRFIFLVFKTACFVINWHFRLW